MKNYVTMFIEYLTDTKNSSSNTILAYERDIERYKEYIDSLGISLKNASNDDVLAFKSKLVDSGLSTSSVSRAMSSVRAFYQFLISKNVVNSNPAKGIKNDKVSKNPFEILSSEEVDRLLAQPSGSDPKSLRDKAMIELMYATGIKVSELVSLSLSNVNLKMEYIKCSNGDKERIILIHKKAVTALKNYIDNARKFLVVSKTESALFVNINGEQMTRQGFWKILKSYASDAGINKTITPGILRHSFATHLLENGADIKEIKDILGHSDLASTQIYMQYLKSQLNGGFLKYHPRY